MPAAMSRGRQEQQSASQRPWHRQTAVQLTDPGVSFNRSNVPPSSKISSPHTSPLMPHDATQSRQMRLGRSPLSASTASFTASPTVPSNQGAGSNVAAFHGMSSPLESLARQGQQSRTNTVQDYAGSRPALHTTKSHMLEKAVALSRSTSIRSTPQEYSPEFGSDRHDDDDDNAEGRWDQGGLAHSTNENARPLNSFTVTSRSGGEPSFSQVSQNAQANTSYSRPRENRSGAFVDNQGGPQRFQPPKAVSTPSSSFDSPNNIVPPANGQSGAFHTPGSHRSALNTMQKEEDGDYKGYGSYRQGTALSRHDSVSSVNTVRTAEFGAGGKWGRAWADRSEDEDEDGMSLYGGSEWGGNGDCPASEYEAGLGLGLSSASGLDALRILAKGAEFGDLTLNAGFRDLTLNNALLNTATLHRVALPRRADSQPFSTTPMESGTDNERARVVSMAPSFHQMSEMTDSNSQAAPPSPLPLRSSQSALAGPMSSEAGGSRVYAPGRASMDSQYSMGGPEGAHVFVYPPTPAGSEAGHADYQAIRDPHGDAADTASIHDWEAVTDNGSEGTASQRSSMASIAFQPHRLDVATTGPSTQSAESRPGPMAQRPITVTSALAGQARFAGSPLARPREAASRPSSVEGKKGGGHPAGRPPPPPPSQYEDPMTAGAVGARLGRARTAAVAAADGRESIVSDLDVETLRLDGSSRRDSSSTLGSRMSIGTIRYSEDGEGAKRVSSADSVSHPTGRDLAAGNSQQILLDYPSSPNRVRFTSDARVLHPSQEAAAAQATPQRASPAAAQQPFPIQRQGSGALANKASTTTLQSQSRRTPNNNTNRHAVGQDTKTGPSVAENYLSQGIQCHEQGDLSRSAYYFERSAKVDGGCVVGMCMWGMTLREGWGARKDPRKGFEWIQRAAATAGELMSTSRNRTEVELKAVRSELKLSVYELGKCFCYGWGVKMDKKMALEYFELAAKLGDADAQAEAGALYAAGKGCKKDLKKAAKYYRMAAAQGYDLIGLSWVWKSKFDD